MQLVETRMNMMLLGKSMEEIQRKNGSYLLS